MIVIRKVARHAGSGRFVPQTYARRYPWLTVVEKVLVTIHRRPSRRHRCRK
jgi:hypothetical protein